MSLVRADGQDTFFGHFSFETQPGGDRGRNVELEDFDQIGVPVVDVAGMQQSVALSDEPNRVFPERPFGAAGTYLESETGWESEIGWKFLDRKDRVGVFWNQRLGKPASGMVPKVAIRCAKKEKLFSPVPERQSRDSPQNGIEIRMSGHHSRLSRPKGFPVQ